MDRTKRQDRKNKISKRLKSYKATAAAQHSKLNTPRNVDESWDYRLPEKYQG